MRSLGLIVTDGLAVFPQISFKVIEFMAEAFKAFGRLLGQDPPCFLRVTVMVVVVVAILVHRERAHGENDLDAWLTTGI